MHVQKDFGETQTHQVFLLNKTPSLFQKRALVPGENDMFHI